MGLLVNIDNGGTFTDVCISDGDRVVHAKSITTPHDLTQCFIDALKRGSRELYGEDDLSRLVRDTDCLRYSTTSGTNAVVEHKGTPVSLLVEAGQEDALYGAAGRFGGSALWGAMVPDRPRGIAVAANGAIDPDALTFIINQLLSQGAQRLAVVLKSPVAERHVKETLLDRYPRHLLGAIPFLISTELVNDTDIARRTATAVINAYLHPGMEHFLYGAENFCKGQHLKRPLLIFRNDGDSARVAKTTAIKTWGSGPRGGLEGAIAYAKLYGLDQVLAMDIGGTTTDVSLVRDGRVALLAHGEVDALPTSFPLPKLQSFGLGGSSIVNVENGAIRIGPESVGAVPGPACFGRGGTQATLTDALLVAGALDANNYLGGELKLDRERALQAVIAQVGNPLGKSAEAAATAIIAAFQHEVGAQLKQVIGAAGGDAGRTTLLAFGGGGPMIVSGIAEAIGIGRVIVPRLAAVFSAFGIGFSHLAHEYLVPLPEVDKAGLGAVRDELMARARRDMSGEGVDPDVCRYDYSVWSVQGDHVEDAPLHGETVPVTPDGKLALKAVFQLPTAQLVADVAGGNAEALARGTQAVQLRGETATVPVYADRELAAGHTAAGPCLVKGDYLTCLIGPGWTLRVSSNRDLILERKQA